MNFPRPCTPLKYDALKELSMLNIQTIIVPSDFEFDLNDEIGLQPNKRPISTVDKNIKKDIETIISKLIKSTE